MTQIISEKMQILPKESASVLVSSSILGIPHGPGPFPLPLVAASSWLWHHSCTQLCRHSSLDLSVAEPERLGAL